MNILEEIVAYKKKEIASAQLLIPKCELQQMKYFERKTYALTEFIKAKNKTGIIAEFKRRSPSKGIINDSSSVEQVTKGYTQFGASALSVLTDFNFFGGSVDDLMKAREVNQIPILRKEFIIDEYQVYEAKAVGADAILLIAAILTPEETKTFAKKANELNLQVLLEFYDEEELDRINDYVNVVGVNNRNLKNFEVNLQHSVQLARKIPSGFVKISESGISTAGDILFLRDHGFDGFLIGENFMKTASPENAFHEFVESLAIKKV